MKKTKFLIKFGVLALIFNIMLISNKSEAQQLSQDPLYQLVFEDNFDSTALRSQNWHTSWYWGKNMWNSNKIHSCIGGTFPGDTVDIAYNTQPPYDTNRTFTNAGGISYQTMIFKRQNFNAPIIAYHNCPSVICSAHSAPCYGSFCGYDSLVPFKFSGAMMLGRYKFKYGYIEMRYKLDNIAPYYYYNAYGPNLWMWASNNADSAEYSEIDIFEQRGYDWHMGMNFHYRKFHPTTHPNPAHWQDTAFWHGIKDPISITSPYQDQIEQSLSYNGGTWHTVGCEWTPDHIDSYYDSNDTIRRFSVTKLPVNMLTAMPIVIDCYMPAAQYCIPFVDGLTQPTFHYNVDYVRVYQINQVANCQTTSGCFPSFATNNFSSILYRDLTVGGVGSAILNSGSYHLAGQDFVLLQSGFEVSGTATVIISTTPCQTDQKLIYDNSKSPSEPLDENILNDINIAKHHDD